MVDALTALVNLASAIHTSGNRFIFALAVVLGIYGVMFALTKEARLARQVIRDLIKGDIRPAELGGPGIDYLGQPYQHAAENDDADDFSRTVVARHLAGQSGLSTPVVTGSSSPWLLCLAFMG